MENSKQLNKIKGIVAICIIALFAVFSFAVYSFVQIGTAKRRYASNAEQILALQTQKQQLETKISAVNEDEYVEEQAKERFEMIKDGEIVYTCE